MREAKTIGVVGERSDQTEMDQSLFVCGWPGVTSPMMTDPIGSSSRPVPGLGERALRKVRLESLSGIIGHRATRRWNGMASLKTRYAAEITATKLI